MLNALSNTILAALEKSSAFYYIRTDTKGNYTFVNDAFRNKFSYISNKFIGESFVNTVYPDDIDKCNQAAFRCMVRPGEVQQISMRKPALDGDFFWTDWEFCAHTNEAGEPQELHCIGYDVTTLIEKQKELLAITKQLEQANLHSESKNESLIKANHELDTFVYRVSHDLRAPISSSLGLIELTLMEKDEEMKRRYITLQKQSLEKLDRFIVDILDYSRNARRDIDPEEILIEKLIKDICQTYTNGSPHIVLTINVVQTAPYYSDKMRLSIILNNLVSNAFKYANPRSEQACVLIEVQANEDLMKLSITDNGIGIDEIFLPRIFDMFFRATDQQVGSGLGLYIVKEAVEKLEGKIFLESKKGEGSAFFVELPNVCR